MMNDEDMVDLQRQIDEIKLQLDEAGNQARLMLQMPDFLYPDPDGDRHQARQELSRRRIELSRQLIELTKQKFNLYQDDGSFPG